MSKGTEFVKSWLEAANRSDLEALAGRLGLLPLPVHSS